MFMKKNYTNRTFTHNYFTSVETFKDGDNIWFALPDIAHNLGLRRFKKTAEILVSPDNMAEQTMQRDLNGVYVQAINFNGVYELMGTSFLSDNENSAFLEWLLNEIIPVLNGEEPNKDMNIHNVSTSVDDNLSNELAAAFKNLSDTMRGTDTNVIQIHTKTSDNNYNMSIEKYFDSSEMNALSCSDWAEVINKIVDNAVYNPALTFDTFKKQRNNFMDNAFKEFQYRSKHRGLKSKACHIRNSMFKDGKSYYECDAVTPLDIIARDTSYREVFEAVLNDMLVERKVIQRAA